MTMPNKGIAGLDDRRRVSYLDGLRGIAAVIVAFDHFSGAFLPWKPGQVSALAWFVSTPPFSLITDGTFSVYIFFALSGFVLAESTSRTKRPLPLLLVTRYLRLTLPMLVSLFFAVILLRLFSNTRAEFASLQPGSWFEQSFHFSGSPTLGRALKEGLWGVYATGLAPVNDVLWTMRKELLGSIFIYGVYKLFPAPHRVKVLLALTALCVLSPPYLGFPLGALFREAWATQRLRDSSWSWLVLIVAVLLATGATTLERMAPSLTSGPFLHGYKIFALGDSIAAAMVLYAVLTLWKLRSWFSATGPVFLGRISFFFYLVHLPLVVSVIPWVALHLSGPIYLDLIVLFLIFMTMVVTLAWILTIIVDEPLTRSLRRLKSPL